jgi:hypothetical protein
MSKHIGAMRAKDARNVNCGCLCRRRVVPVLDAIFSKPILAFYSYCFLFFYLLLLFFFVQELIKGHCPGVVTNGDNITHKYFHINEKVGS